MIDEQGAEDPQEPAHREAEHEEAVIFHPSLRLSVHLDDHLVAPKLDMLNVAVLRPALVVDLDVRLILTEASIVFGELVAQLQHEVRASVYVLYVAEQD